jgi:alkylhydroperoxidase family enzyme
MSSFVSEPAPTAAAQRMYDEDLGGDGYVANHSRVWAHQPSVWEHLVAAMGAAASGGDLTFRQRGVLISAFAPTLGDSYCSLAWGSRLAGEVGPEVAASVIGGDDSGLDSSERALAAWARRVAGDPNAATVEEVEALREAGFDDDQIVAITAYVALRLAFSTVNDALGAGPDTELGESAPPEIREAVDFGRPVA